MIITIFTPTFNRGYTLGRLYRSLCRQTDKNFEWVIVDDGSTDDTKSMISEWIAESILKIRYCYQDNSGKPAAHNRGVSEAKGELFCCVDSDDYLREDAIEKILKTWMTVSSECIGIIAFRYSTKNTPITTISADVDYSTLHGAYKYHSLKGDTMLIYETDIMKKYAFPVIEGEKFIPEGYLYNKLDKEGPMKILREGLYLCEYLDDGYTANVDKLIYNNYKGYILHLKTRIKEVDSFSEKFFDSIRYDAISIGHSCNNIVKNSEDKILSILAYLPGYILYRKRYLPIIRSFEKKKDIYK